jgi:hypothetical protein
MSAAAMPTKIEAVTSNLSDVAQRHAVLIASVPDQIEAITGWAFTPEQFEAVKQLAWRLGHEARLLQVGLDLVSEWASTTAEDDRTLFAKTSSVVDMCRFGRAIPSAGPVPHPSTTALADVVEDAMADMQEALRARFPGETIPGG